MENNYIINIKIPIRYDFDYLVSYFKVNGITLCIKPDDSLIKNINKKTVIIGECLKCQIQFIKSYETLITGYPFCLKCIKNVSKITSKNFLEEIEYQKILDEINKKELDNIVNNIYHDINNATQNISEIDSNSIDSSDTENVSCYSSDSDNTNDINDSTNNETETPLDKKLYCINHATKIEGRCLTVNCPNYFLKTFKSLIHSGGPYCNSCVKKNNKIKKQSIQKNDQEKEDKEESNDNNDIEEDNEQIIIQKTKYNYNALMEYVKLKNIKLSKTYNKIAINGNTVVEGNCLTFNCKNIFFKSFKVLAKKDNPYCKNCTRIFSNKKLKETLLKKSENITRIKLIIEQPIQYSYNYLLKFFDANNIQLLTKFNSDIEKRKITCNTEISGKCIVPTCDNIFNKLFSSILTKNGGAYCIPCTHKYKIYRDDVINRKETGKIKRI